MKKYRKLFSLPCIKPPACFYCMLHSSPLTPLSPADTHCKSTKSFYMLQNVLHCPNQPGRFHANTLYGDGCKSLACQQQVSEHVHWLASIRKQIAFISKSISLSFVLLQMFPCSKTFSQTFVSLKILLARWCHHRGVMLGRSIDLMHACCLLYAEGTVVQF